MRLVLLLALVAFPVFASATEAPPFEIPGDVPAVAAQQPLVSDTVAMLIGALVLKALVDGAASAFNAHLRGLKAKGIKASPLKLFVGSVLNALALNLDQTVRQGRAGAGKAGPTEPAS